MSDDKVIRIGVDGSKGIQDVSRLKDNFVGIQKDLNRISEEGKSLNKDELKDIQAKINLVKQQFAEEDRAARSKIANRQIEIQLAEKDLALWKARRAEEGAGLQGLAKKKFDTDTRKEGGRRGADLAEERIDELTKKRELNSDKSYHQKSIKELQEIADLLGKPKETPETKIHKFFQKTFGIDLPSGGGGTVGLSGGRSRAGGGGLMRGAVGGVRSVASGDIAGTIAGAAEGGMAVAGASAAVAAAVAAAIAAAVSSAASFQKGIAGYAVTSQTPISQAKQYAFGARSSSLGMSGVEVLDKMSGMIRALGGGIGTNSAQGLIGAQVSRGFSDQQIQQILTISRYTNRSGMGTISDLEKYSMAKDKNLIRLPELMDSYLKAVNEILNRTGKVDAIGVQQSIMSVGKSYGVGGLQLDKINEGMNSLSELSDNPFWLNQQQIAYKKYNPTGRPSEMVEAFQNIGQNPELRKILIDQIMSIGGKGSEFNAMLGGSKLNNMSLYKQIAGKEMTIQPKGIQPTSEEDKALNKKAVSEADKYVGSLNQAAVRLGEVADTMTKAITWLTDGTHSKLTGEIREAVKDGVVKGNKESGRK